MENNNIAINIEWILDFDWQHDDLVGWREDLNLEYTKLVKVYNKSIWEIDGKAFKTLKIFE